MHNESQPADPSAGHSEVAAPRRPSRWPLLAVVLVLAVLSAAAPRLDAPWLQGDEYMFIVNRSDINGAGRNEPFWRRWLGIFTHVHGDLYQPIPIAMYALEWRLSGGQPTLTRVVDVLLHALNGLLVWAVLCALLRRFAGSDGGGRLGLLAWALALIWALHPVHVTSYAADMCRTHLLSALFSLIALWLYLTALAPRVRWAGFAGSLLALLAAMLSKPVVGWFLLAVGLELAINGLRPSLRSVAFYVRTGLAAGVCVAFALLTLGTTVESGLLEDTSQAAFGGPVERSLLAVWLYARNLVVPLWLSPWYPPDPNTGWGNPRVWAGAAIALASVLVMALAARRPAARGTALGIVWVWALLLPVIGVVAARVAAGNDRYLYQPLMGILLAAGVVLSRRVAGAPLQHQARAARIIVTAAVVLAAAMMLWDRTLCEVMRSTIARAVRAVELNPGDPRALEGLGQAYDFATTRPTPEGRAANPPDFARQAVSTFIQAGSIASQKPTFFSGPHDRAACHRRLSFRLLRLSAAAASLEQARIASELEPDAPASWVCLARAHRALRQWEQAAQAYERVEAVLPADASNRALLLTEFGMLLEDPLARIDDARKRYRAALQADPAFVLASIGLARLEVRFGQGEAGYAAIQAILERQPLSIDALLVAGEYHLRSHRWDQAREAYVTILQQDAVRYDALRGFHEVCMQTDRWSEAIAGWDHAARNAPDPAMELVYRSFQVWASACAGEPRALEASKSLTRVDPENRFASLTAMLFALRDGRVDEAAQWAARSSRGVALPQANEQARAIATLRLLREKGQLLSESTIVEAVLLRETGRTEQARELLTGYLAEHSDSKWRTQADELLTGLPQPGEP